MDELITEDWLKSVGFKWHQFDRQPHKHWLLWLGDVFWKDILVSYDELGIEVSSRGDDFWFCWLRSDMAGRYHRFIHIRHLRTQDELVHLIEGITGRTWDPMNNMYGWMRSPEQAARIREEDKRLDHKIMHENPSWFDIEKDDTRGGALPEHLAVYASEHEA